MHHRQSLGRAALAAVLLSLLLVVAAAAPGAGGKSSRPQAVKSKSDSARAKLDKRLRALVEKGATKRVFVYATAKSDAAADAAALLRNGRYANAGDISLVVGSLRVTAATKLAGLPGVTSVKRVQLKQTASPLGIPEPNLNQAPSKSSLQSAMNDLRQQEVPYSGAPAPRGSNFDRLKQLGVLDAKTHKFADAWNAGLRRRGHDRQRPRRRHGLGASRSSRTRGRRGRARRTRSSRTTAGTAGRRPSTRTTRWSGSSPQTSSTRGSPGTRRRRRRARSPRTLRTRRRICCASASRRASARRATSTRRTRRSSHSYTFPKAWTKSGHRPHGEPSGRPSAPALRRAPCDSRHRPEHGGRLRHGLRRSRRRLPVRRREAGHESIAGLVPRHERGRLHRPLGRPSLLHLGRRDRAAGRHHALHGRLAGVP